VREDSLTCPLEAESFSNTPSDFFGMNWAFSLDNL
jgi:hypothetical protein